MKLNRVAGLLFLMIAGGALALRTVNLSGRPMHTDEAVHAIKFGDLLEHGCYQYDPYEYHGPSLNYFTLIPAWLTGEKNISEVKESTLRIVPVFFGVGMILLLLPVVDVLSWPVVLLAALGMAVSPAMVYYSGYYIQEMLLVCFTLGTIVAGYRYVQKPGFFRAAITGVFLGLMHACKETCIIIWAALALALLVNRYIYQIKPGTAVSSSFRIRPAHLFIAIFAAVFVSVFFYSSAFTNPRGIIDSVSFFAYYADRAGDNPLHIHPWYYYLSLYFYFHLGAGPIWSEAIILVSALLGLMLALPKNRWFVPPLISFLAWFTLFLTGAYSAIPYKTPWCMLGPLQGMIIMAAWTVVFLFRKFSSAYSRLFLGVVLLAGFGHLGIQAWRAVHAYNADSRNPYVYAHTSADIFSIVKHVENVARNIPQGYDIPVQVICPGHDYWPLPWYLRGFTNVYWWDAPDPNVPPAPIVLAYASLEKELIRYFQSPPPGRKNLYIPLWPEYLELRPTIELRGYITNDLWQEYQLRESQNQSSTDPKVAASTVP